MAEHETSFTRLVFGVPVGSRPARDLTEAAEIARWLGLELAAMMIEDEAISALTAHPGARLLSATGSAHALHMARTMKREVRTATSAFRRQLEREATHASLVWSFKAVRGAAETVVAHAVRQSDIAVYCEPASSLEREAYPERRLWQAIEQSPAAALYRPSRPLPSRSGIMAIGKSGAQGASVDIVAGKLGKATGEPVWRVEPDGDWRALPAQWNLQPPRLIVLTRGTMGLQDGDTIALAARTLRIPLLVLEKAS